MPARSLKAEARREARRWLCRSVSPYHPHRQLPEPSLWPDIIEAADRALLMPRLFEELRPLHGDLPGEVFDLLETVSLLNSERNRQIVDQTVAVIGTLNARGVEPVILKGNAILLTGGPNSGSRMVTDLDLWIPEPAGQQAALAALQAEGYRPTRPLAKFRLSDHHHYPSLHRPGTAARVEVHHRLTDRELDELFDEAAAARRVASVELGVGRLRLLDPLDGLAVSYIQSTYMAVPVFGLARVPFMKWVDFLDRLAAVGGPPPQTRRDSGLRGEDGPVDRMFFTALQSYFGYPYNGPRDETYVQRRERQLEGGWHGAWLPELLTSLGRDLASPKLFRLRSWRRAPLILQERVSLHRRRKGL